MRVRVDQPGHQGDLSEIALAADRGARRTMRAVHRPADARDASALDIDPPIADRAAG